jgi:hypothetical protein
VSAEPPCTATTKTIDFYFYAPINVLRPDLYSPEEATKIVHGHFQHAIEDPLMFESLISLSRANLTIKDWNRGRPDESTLYHYCNAIKNLREAVSSEKLTSDSILFAIIALMNVDVRLVGCLS